jgi:hypothetical protein
MKTFRNGRRGDFLGADLTDRYAMCKRLIDVCGLTSALENRLRASFWQWQWPSPESQLDVSLIAHEITMAKSAMLDGPQGLAAIGQSLRACERQSGAVGKTADRIPVLGRPFAGYIRSSIELFSGLAQAGITVSPDGFVGGVSEVYPGNIWTRLVKRAIPKKSTRDGRLARKQILEALGVIDLPDLPTHDENDACISAVLAAAANGKVAGLTVRGLGLPLAVDPDGTMREGLMVIPEITDEAHHRIQKALSEAKVATVAKIRASRKSNTSQEARKRADALRNAFIERAQNGDSQVCTYGWAYRHLFEASYAKWSQGYTSQVVSIAQDTSLADLPGLGEVRLDAFIVASKTRLPSDGHWESAHYDREDWERVLGTARLLK